MRNVEMEMKGAKLVITVDTSKDLGPSTSGKSILIGTSGGNQPFGDFHVGVNVFKKKDKVK
jgi:hypothetical protein